MSIIRPFRGLRPNPNYITQVIAPPYDVLSSREAKIYAQNKPWNFLHISKPEIDLPENTNPYDEKVYAKATENFSHMRNQKILQKDKKPHYYLYRLTMNEHQQTGIVATVSIKAYQENRVKKHEQTQPIKVADRIKQIQAVNAQTGPVLLTYSANKNLKTLFQQITKDKPTYDVIANDKVHHQLWLIQADDLITNITQSFATIDNLYIADGHHRSEAANEISKLNPNANAQYFLSVIFPDDELQILSYNRIVKDLNGLSIAEFFQKIKNYFLIEESSIAVQPKKAGQFGMFINSQWFLLTLLPKINNKESLDVSLLATYLLEPILNIKDPRRDPRIEFIGGIRGLKELEKRVNSSEMAVAFSLHATQIKDVMNIADKLEFMPPKSTWFEPKLADGLVSHLLED